MARDRDEPVVRAGVDRHGPSAERGHEPVHGAEQLRPGTRGRSQKPGRALEQLGVGTLRAARLGSADRMAADEAAVAVRRGARPQLFVEPTSVTAHRSGATASTSRTTCGKLGDRRCDEHELGAGDGVRERRRRLDGFPLVGDAEHVGVGVPAAHGGAGATRGECCGRADQARPDDGHVPEHGRR